MSVLRPSAREQRTIQLGATVVGVALLVAFVLVPFARRWSDREGVIAVARDRVARLLALTAQEPQLRTAAAASDEGTIRALRGRTVALVGSDLQSLLQDYARVSRVSVTRLEVGNAADSTVAPERGLSASVSATTDVYGLADLLVRLQSGPALLVVDALAVTVNPVLRGNLLQLSLTARAPFLLEP